MFAALLRNRLRGSALEQVPDLHRRACSWYQTNGCLTEALQHAHVIQDYEVAAQIIEQAADALKMISDWGQILLWLQGIPEPMIHDRPRLALLNAWGLVLTDQIASVETLLASAQRSLSDYEVDEPARRHWRGQIAAIQARLAY